MIRIKNKSTEAIPSILHIKGREATEVLKRRYDDGERNFSNKDFDSEIYSDKDVKDKLIALQYFKCCFCESKIGHISFGDVEHFRPKAGWVQNYERPNVPGYYWLAYEWDNLLLSCQLCNQRYKKNFFPLLDNHQRALSHHHNLALEKPVFINPGKDEVESMITFREEIPVAIDNNVRGKETILKLKLDRELLNEQRRTRFNLIKTIYDLAKGYPDTDLDLKNKARNLIIEYFTSSKSDKTEYASMYRAFFRDNPIDF